MHNLPKNVESKVDIVELSELRTFLFHTFLMKPFKRSTALVILSLLIVVRKETDTFLERCASSWLPRL